MQQGARADALEGEGAEKKVCARGFHALCLAGRRLWCSGGTWSPGRSAGALVCVRIGRLRVPSAIAMKKSREGGHHITRGGRKREGSVSCDGVRDGSDQQALLVRCVVCEDRGG